MDDRLTKAHEFAWSTIRPIIGNSLPAARALIEAGLTPPIVRLTADVGCLTLYDAAMIHRVGENRTYRASIFGRISTRRIRSSDI